MQEITKITPLLRQSNALTRSRYNFSRIEKNVVYLIIKKVRQDYVEGTLNRDLWQNMYVYFTNEDLSLAASEDNLKYAKKALRSLRQKAIEIEDEQGNWLIVGFINYAKYDPTKKTYEVEVSKEIMPHLVELSKYYTEYSLTVAISLKSKYSQRLYELASRYKNMDTKQFRVGYEELRQMLRLGDKYSQIQDFRRYVLDIAVMELAGAFQHNQCDLDINYVQNGRGKDTSFTFSIIDRESLLQHQDVKNPSIQISHLLEEQGRYLSQRHKELFPRDGKFRKRIAQKLNDDPALIPMVYNKLKLREKEYTKNSDLAKIYRYILKEDFGVD